MDIPTLRGLLQDALAAVERGEAIDDEALSLHLSRLPDLAEGATREDLLALQADIDALTEAATVARDDVGEMLVEIGRGRRGNRGYNSIKAIRKAQRLYRRA